MMRPRLVPAFFRFDEVAGTFGRMVDSYRCLTEALRQRSCPRDRLAEAPSEVAKSYCIMAAPIGELTTHRGELTI